VCVFWKHRRVEGEVIITGGLLILIWPLMGGSPGEYIFVSPQIRTAVSEVCVYCVCVCFVCIVCVLCVYSGNTGGGRGGGYYYGGFANPDLAPDGGGG
jgi:hypothetical protein